MNRMPPYIVVPYVRPILPISPGVPMSAHVPYEQVRVQMHDPRPIQEAILDLKARYEVENWKLRAVRVGGVDWFVLREAGQGFMFGCSSLTACGMEFYGVEIRMDPTRDLGPIVAEHDDETARELFLRRKLGFSMPPSSHEPIR